MSEPTPPELILDVTRPFTVWNITEIYTGTGTGRYVPNLNDAVLDWSQGWFRVIHVDYTTGLSTIVKFTEPRETGPSTDEDILLGGGPGTISESFRIYLDTSVTPHTFACNSRLRFHGTSVSYVKIFKGTNIGVDGDVISAYFDQSGNFLGENIPVELVAMPNQTNLAVKTPAVGYTLREFPDGELVSVVAYTSTGQVSSINKLIVMNTAFIRTTDASMRYIQAIDLESPFISSSNPRLIQYPINMPVDSLNLMGVVTYSDGSKVRFPVNGTKFSIYGLDSFIASIQGQTLDVVLTYQLSANEFNYMATPSGDRHVSQRYQATTVRADNAYSVKLFTYPVWIDELHGYRLETYLYNLDRQRVYNVTNYTQAAQGSRAFDPLTYGSVQHIALAIDMNRVDASYAHYRHVQTFEVALLAQGTTQLVDNWTIGFTPGQNPPYGRSMEAKAHMVNQNLWQLRIDNLEPIFDRWLDKTFYSTQPLFDSETENKAPTPNYFAIVFGTFRAEFPISQWNQIMQLTQMPVEGHPIFIQWIRRSNTNDLQLGVSGMIVHHYNAIDGTPSGP
jgi:hypothetical protein